MSDLGALEKQWISPSAIYRGAPFWSWNSELGPDRLQREIESMHGAGMGGAFMHSRYGLKTPYLSERWFECVSACVEKAQELDMKAYMYDEDRWPSGPAGGLVTRENPQFRLKYLSASFDDTDPATDKVHAVFDVQLDDRGRLVSYEMIAGPGEVMSADEVTAERPLFFCPGFQEPSGWTNDGGYLDTLDPEAVAEFLRVTHEAYAERYGDVMGEIIPAVFTDEPSYGAQIHGTVDGRHRIPWTCVLADEFERRRGYSLRDRLPEVVLPLADGEFSKVRHDYFRTITELFVEAFSEQVGQWCGEHDIALTGHMLAEQTLASQRQAIGAAMPHYEFMQWPGIDLLRDQCDELLTAKQCTSVADQLGAERVLTELYGCTGWDWRLEGHKFIGDWQWVCGINFRCPHLTHYSLAGGAKRDYPASIRDHSPWWPYYDTVEDYFARLSVMLTAGRPIRDVLVIHPIESGWGLTTGPEGMEAIERLNEQLNGIIYELMGQHYDFDLGDESLLAKHARVAEDTLTVGRMTYRVVVVPPSITLRETTLGLLEELVEAGGTVIFAGDCPSLVDGEPDDRPATLRDRALSSQADPQSVIATLEDVLPRRVRITEEGKQADFVWAMLREIDDGHLVFIQSHDRESSRTVTVSVNADGPIVEWDAMTGRRITVAPWEADGRVAFEVELDPTGSGLFTIGIDVPQVEERAPRRSVVDRTELAGPFDIERTEPNTMPLDYCQFRIADEEFSEPVPTLKADEQIRARYGLGTRLGPEHQPWYLYTTGVVDTEPRDTCQMRYTFHVTTLPRSCRLALENPEDYTVTVNGAEVSEVDGWWVDDDIETIDI
ncbi:MAG: glycosyl hydrolase, partial [Armatimonadota bacterium]